MPTKQKKNTPSEFPVHIYSELTDIAFRSDQMLINSLLRGKEKEKRMDRMKKTDEEEQLI